MFDYEHRKQSDVLKCQKDLLINLLTDEALEIPESPNNTDERLNKTTRKEKIERIVKVIEDYHNDSPFKGKQITMRYSNRQDLILDCDTARGKQVVAHIKLPSIITYIA
jgi:hypothetical protein